MLKVRANPVPAAPCAVVHSNRAEARQPQVELGDLALFFSSTLLAPKKAHSLS